MITINELCRAICCEGRPCISPEACYAADRSRSYPVRIHAAAEAVEKLICERWNEKKSRDGQETC